jgi:putative SOS response-associated peptidase YedK
MCGRFTLYKTGREIAAPFGLAEEPQAAPRYNIAPTQQVLVVRREDGRRTAARLRWGMATPWGPPGAPLINARSETVMKKPTFRQSFSARRCLVPADGFYEWKAVGREKQPFYFTVNGGSLFAIAGIWEPRPGEAGAVALLTTEANEVVGVVHNRMPVILPPAAWEAWLEPAAAPEALLPLLCPYTAGEMAARAVSKAVNTARNDGPECIEPAGPAQARLF